MVALGFAAGAAADDEVTSTRGVVSSASTTFRDPSPDVPGYREAVQTDTALNPGYSGGPLVDLEGRLVGVNAAARTTGSDGRPLEGQNYAIGIERARRVLAELRKGRSISWIGATFGYPTTEELLDRKLPPGLYLTGAVPGTPAARAGLGGRGELLAGVEGRALALLADLLLRGGRRPRPRRRQLKLTLARPGGGKPREVDGGAGVSRAHRSRRRPLAVVLAGGRSSRMGSPKALVELGGRPLVAWVLAAALEAGLEAVVVAKPGSPLPPLDVPVWPEPEQPLHPLTGRRRRARARGPARRRRPRLRHAVRDAGADRAAGGARRRRGGAARRGLPRPLRAVGAAGPARRPRARGAAARRAGRARGGRGRRDGPRTSCSASTIRRRWPGRRRCFADRLGEGERVGRGAARERGQPAGDRGGAALGGVRGHGGELQQRLDLGRVRRRPAERLGELHEPLVGGRGHARRLACGR